MVAGLRVGKSQERNPPSHEHLCNIFHSECLQAETVVGSFLYALPAPGHVPGKQQVLSKPLLGE